MLGSPVVVLLCCKFRILLMMLLASWMSLIVGHDVLDESADMEKAESGQVRLDPEEEEALNTATLDDIMALADILNTNPQDFVMEAYADPLQYFEPDPPNTTNPKEILEKLNSNDKETKDVNLNNVSGISEQLFCDIFNAIKNNDQITKLSACNCDVSNTMME